MERVVPRNQAVRHQPRGAVESPRQLKSAVAVRLLKMAVERMVVNSLPGTCMQIFQSSPAGPRGDDFL